MATHQEKQYIKDKLSTYPTKVQHLYKFCGYKKNKRDLEGFLKLSTSLLKNEAHLLEQYQLYLRGYDKETKTLSPHKHEFTVHMNNKNDWYDNLCLALKVKDIYGSDHKTTLKDLDRDTIYQHGPHEFYVHDKSHAIHQKDFQVPKMYHRETLSHVMNWWKNFQHHYVKEILSYFNTLTATELANDLNREQFINVLMKILLRLLETEDLYDDGQQTLNFIQFLENYLHITPDRALIYKENFITYMNYKCIHPLNFIVRESASAFLPNYIYNLHEEHLNNQHSLQATKAEIQKFWEVLINEFFVLQFSGINNIKELISGVLDRVITKPTKDELVAELRVLYQYISKQLKQPQKYSKIKEQDQYLKGLNDNLKLPYYYPAITENEKLLTNQNDVLRSLSNGPGLSLLTLTTQEANKKIEDFKSKNPNFVDFEKQLNPLTKNIVIVPKSNVFSGVNENYYKIDTSLMINGELIGCGHCGKIKPSKDDNGQTPLLSIAEDLQIDPLSNELIGCKFKKGENRFSEYVNGNLHYLFLN